MRGKPQAVQLKLKHISAPAYNTVQSFSSAEFTACCAKQLTLSGGIWQNPKSPQYNIQKPSACNPKLLNVLNNTRSILKKKGCSRDPVWGETDTELVREGFLIHHVIIENICVINMTNKKSQNRWRNIKKDQMDILALWNTKSEIF